MKKLCLVLTLLNARLTAEEAAPAAADQGFTQTLVMMAIAFLFFYFILYRPEQKRRKVLEEQRNTMRQGDKVVAMGIIGTVLRVQDTSVILKMYDGSKIEVLKGAITEILPSTGETKEGE